MYSLYLVHVPVGGRVINVGRRFFTELWTELHVLIVAFVTCLAVALLFYIFVERPAIRAA